jgi:hypothetical protein
MTRAQAGKNLRDALTAAIERSGRLDPLLKDLERRKQARTRYRAKRAEARREAVWHSTPRMGYLQ